MMTKKDIFTAIIKKNKDEITHQTFYHMYPSFSIWEKDMIEIMGVVYEHLLMELWQYSDDIPKTPGSPRFWVRTNLYENYILPKNAVKKLTEKAYG